MTNPLLLGYETHDEQEMDIATFLILSGASMNMYSTFKTKILVRLKWSYRFRQVC